jgi:plasmid stabilization system protein ParE
MRVIWTEQAWERLLEIERFVARDDPRAAARLVDRLIDRGDALAEHPDRGRRLPELPDSGLRELVIGNYRIVYRRTPSAVVVLTVFEGQQGQQGRGFPVAVEIDLERNQWETCSCLNRSGPGLVTRAACGR